MAHDGTERRKKPGWGAKRPECASVRRDDIQHDGLLGNGIQGHVYRGYVPLFGVCAVKYLLARNGPFILQTEREAVRELVASLELAHHPNIVNFYGQVVEETGGNVLGFFSEYMEGGCLRDVMIAQVKENDQSWFKKATRWSVQAARALAFCHDRKVIHRDVKPDNMLLSRDQMTIKICDFGLARPSTDTPRNKTCNKGSFLYIAPETIGAFGARLEYTFSCDVFSFGMFLYAVFNRSDPFTELYDTQQMNDPLMYRKMLENEYRPFCTPNVPSEVVDIMQRCWQTNPDERPSMSDVAAQLAGYWIQKYPGEVF